MRPVLADSRMPNGEMSFMKESIRDGLAELNLIKTRYHQDKVRLTLQQYNCSC